jgi:hypothetical protein
VPADPPVTTVAELHLVSTTPGLAPRTLLLLELDTDQAEDAGGTPTLFPLTLAQAREVCASLEKLLAAAASA